MANIRPDEVDMRLAADGSCVVLEANPNPDLCAKEDFALSAKAAGTAYPDLVQRILTLGLRHTPAWQEA